MPKLPQSYPKLTLNPSIYALILTLSTLLTVALLAHHPVPGAHMSADVNRLVHGGLLALLILTCTGMSGFAWRLGIDHPAVMAGWLAYVLGTFSLIIAGLINGFVATDVPEFIKFLWALNQAATRLGLVLIGFAILMWGHALMHHRGIARLIALLAIAIGGASAVYILVKSGQIDVPTLFIFMAGQLIWNLTVAAWLLKKPVISPT